MKYLKLFASHSDYNTAKSSLDKPNVSHCINENEVHYNPWVETRLVGIVNVTSTSSATRIMDSLATSQFSQIEIDGVVQPSVVSSYQFDTIGEHIVKYTLVDPTTIGEYAFNFCSDITSIVIPNSVTSIDEGAFKKCGLTSITIPSGITSIDNRAFYQCASLTNIISLATTAPTVEDYTFYYIKTDGTLTVPSGSTGYDVWMGTGNYYLGQSNWTKVEQ